MKINQKSKKYLNLNSKRGVDFIGVTCVFYCHDGKRNLLLHKRSSKCRDEQGRWDCGGGAMEHGETFEKTVRREVKEEYCAEIKDLKFVSASNVLRDNNGTKTHWIALIFLALVDPNEVKIGEPEKIDEIGWFSFDTLPSPLHSMFPQSWEIVKKSCNL